MNHYFAITVYYTCNIYLERCEGLLCTIWEVENPVTYKKFRGILSSQMLWYNPVQKRYPGYHNIMAVTKVVKTQKPETVGEVTEKELFLAKKKRWICKDITTLCVHSEIPGFVKKPLKCVWCGLDVYFFLIVCLDYNKKPIPLHLNTTWVNVVGKQLFFMWHDANNFGLRKMPYIKSWKYPNINWKNNTERNLLRYR